MAAEFVKSTSLIWKSSYILHKMLRDWLLELGEILAKKHFPEIKQIINLD